ncbi:glycoside hydrolase family 10 protein [Paenibacillus septentrionalis]|uniref:Glycoside hydrolase family 10 protein n=1 Tax=Paenibacillus septentrionalis TaxID=429342 RepID=A0ABW1UZ47_9BACL
MQVKRVILVCLSCLLVMASFSLPIASAAEENVVTSVVFEDFEDFGTTGDVYATQSAAADRIALTQADKPAPVMHGLSSAKLEYDFTNTTGTSAAYIWFKDADGSTNGRTLEGSPSKIGFWVHGQGFKYWIRGHLLDKDGKETPIDFTTTSTVIDGWQYVSANIPAAIEGPIKLRRIYLVETSAKTQGTIYIDHITLLYGNSQLAELELSDIRSMQVGETLTPKLLATKNGDKQPTTIALNQAALSSSMPEVAEISADGVIEAKALGSTTITAVYNGRAASYQLSVSEHAAVPEQLIVTGPASLVPTEEVAVQAFAVYNGNELVDVTALTEFTSSDEAIASVNGSAIRGVSYGEVTISGSYTTEAYGTLTSSLDLQVQPGELRSIAIKDVFSAYVDGEPITAKVYGTYRIEGEKPITEGVTFSVQNPDIASIDAETGEIYGLAPGVTTVYADVNGQRVSQQLIVTNAISSPKYELRGAWVSTVENIDWPAKGDTDPASQRADFVKLLDDLQAAGINAIFTQVRPTADSFFPSEYFPWSHWLTGKQGVAPSDGYDPLAFMIEEAHKRNMEFHAWINPFRVAMHTNVDALAEGHPARVNQGWTVPYGGKLYFNPAIPEVRDYISEAVAEIVQNYDVDGIHMDDYFYPYPVGGEEFADGAQYNAYIAAGGQLSLGDWRRENVNQVVSGLYETIKEEKSYVKFGISPFGIWKNKNSAATGSDPTGSDTTGLESYSAVYADMRKWIQNGWVDYIAPQIYWQFGLRAAAYEVLVDWWKNEVEQYADTHDVHLYVGHATYKVGTSGWEHEDQLPAQLRYAQDNGVHGSILFSSNHFLANPLGALDGIKETYVKPSLIPVMPWLGGEAPRTPTLAQTKNVSSGVQLKWKADNKGEKPRYYVIYRASGKQAPSTTTTEHMVATVAATKENMQLFIDHTAVPGETYTYVVTAVSRLHVESEASKSSTIAVKKVKNEH